MNLSNLHKKIACLAVFTVACLLTTLTFAIDNPDAPDYISEFKSREKIFTEKINNPNNTNQEYLDAYNDYLIFLDKELNAAYGLLIPKLQKNHQEEIKNSQRKWLEFRDAEFKFIISNWTRDNFGSSAWISRGDYRTTIVKERVMQLLHYALNY
jgi:uncharacterized protein YecT (DUF1311 family)